MEEEKQKQTRAVRVTATNDGNKIVLKKGPKWAPCEAYEN